MFVLRKLHVIGAAYMRLFCVSFVSKMPRLDGDNCNVFAGVKCNGVNKWVGIEMCHMWAQEACNAVEGIWGMYVKTPRPTPSRKAGSDVIFLFVFFLVARTCKHYERRASGLTSMYFLLSRA